MLDLSAVVERLLTRAGVLRSRFCIRVVVIEERQRVRAYGLGGYPTSETDEALKAPPMLCNIRVRRLIGLQIVAGCDTNPWTVIALPARRGFFGKDWF